MSDSDQNTHAVVVEGAGPSSATFARVDAEFGWRMDRWGAYHRMAVSSLTMAVTFSILPQPDWLLWTAALYLGLSALVPTALELARSDRAKAAVRLFVMFVDVLSVSMFVYRWGARSSPAAFMYVPIVSGWTLIPQRHIGRFASTVVMLAYGGLLAAEQLGWSERGHDVTALLSSDSVTGALVYFATLACAVVAVHGLVDFTVARLREHGQVITQLTAEKKTREREGQLVIQLEEAQRLEALGRLAGGVAHDFNNLLTVLMGCAELAEFHVGKQQSEVAVRALQDLQSAAERGASLTAQLLDFASRRPASPRDVDLNVSLATGAKLLERLLEPNVEMHVTKSREPCVVHIDPSGFERLLLNLAVNARDAMPTGGKLGLTIRRQRTEGEDQVVLEVSDTGVGIGSAELPHIFEPFFTTKARGKGTGLGLASVYGLVKQSQGNIEVDSKLHVGTTFRITWPRVARGASAAHHKSQAPTGGDECILLVDDDVEVRTIVRSHLEGAGYAVLQAGAGEEALRLLDQNAVRVQMLVSDVSMPGMSGVELARKVREKSPHVPILLISGFSEELHGSSERVGRFLAKPFSGQQLLTEVRTSLDARTSRPA